MLTAAATGRSPLPMSANSSTGRVISRPPPMIRVLRYWLQESRKANNPATTTPGMIIGSITRSQTAGREAPSERAWDSKSGL